MRLMILALFLFLSVPVGAMESLSSTRQSNIGQAAVDMVLAKTDGTQSSVVSAFKGKKSILVFWATWCPHCRSELDKIYPQLSAIEAKGVKINFVDAGESAEEVNAFFARRQMNLVSFLDEENALSEPYQIEGVPTLIFIDEQGIICHVDHELPADFENYFK